MANLDKVLLMGNLTRDPEVRYSPKGICICQIGIAVNRKWTGDNGEVKEEVTFLNLVAWGKRGETIGQYFKKGSPIFIEGHHRQESWEDKATGHKRTALKIVVDNFQFIGGGNRSEEEQPAGQTRRAAAQPAARSAASEGGYADGSPDDDDDVPF